MKTQTLAVRIMALFLVVLSLVSVFIPQAFAADTTETTVPTSILDGKSIMFLGDSYTAGYGISSYSNTWNGMLASSYGMKVTCNSVSCSTFGTASTEKYAPGGCYSPISQRSLPNKNFDIVFIQGGSNDWYCEIPLGAGLESRDTTTFIGAVNTTIDRVREAYPKAVIVCMTPWASTGYVNGLGLTSNDYGTAMSAICQYRDILCYNAMDEESCGIYTTSTTFRKNYFLKQTDIWHLNEAGHKLFLPTIATALANFYAERGCVAGYYDVPKTSWFAESVQYVTDNGLFNGYPNNYFAPDEYMTRGMLITVLYRASGSPDVSDLRIPFEDIPHDAYYTNAVIWGWNLGIVNGTSSTKFAPDTVLTREQMVTMLYRYSNGANNVYGSEVVAKFNDADSISTFAKSAMYWAVGNGIINGTSSTTLSPQNPATRSQTAKVLMVYFETFGYSS